MRASIMMIVIAAAWLSVGMLWGYKLAGGFNKKPPLMPCYKAETIYDLKGVPFRGTSWNMESIVAIRGTHD